MHAGDKPYVVSPTGQIDVASRGLTLEALNTIVGQLLPAELQAALDEFGAVQYELPAADEFPGQHFTVVAARGGDDVWTEIRRRRVPDDHVPDELFGPTLSAPVAAPQVLSLPAAAPASTFARSDADDLCAETPGFAGATVQMAQEEDDVLLLPGGAELWGIASDWSRSVKGRLRGSPSTGQAERAAFAPKALPPSLKRRRTAVALAETGRRASPKPGRIAAGRRRETFSRAKASSISISTLTRTWRSSRQRRHRGGTGSRPLRRKVSLTDFRRRPRRN